MVNVTKLPDQPSYNHGTYVQLTANPDTGWHFVNWTGNLSGSINPEQILMDGDKTVTANFAINTYSLTVNVNPSSSGSVTINPPTGPYTHGTWVKLTPNPNLGWHFFNWTDSLTGSFNPDSIYMNSNKVVTATFAINTYTLTVNTTGNGNVTKLPDQPTYNHGTYVQLTANSDTGWHFVNWAGNLSGSNNPEQILMDGDKTVTANFAINTYSLTVNVNPSSSGSVTIDPPVGPYNHGTWVKLTPNPNLGWHFFNWTDSLTGSFNQDSIYMNSNKVVTANFSQNAYSLTIYINGSGSVVKNPDLPSYTYGMWVKLQAISDTGWHFVNWTGHLNSSSSVDSVFIDNNKTINANFAINTYLLTVTVNPPGTGYVTLDPSSGPYAHGTWVKLQPYAYTGYHFASWSGDLIGSNIPDSVYMNVAKSVTANYEINTYTLNITINGNGVVTKTPDLSTYQHNSVVRLNAYPASGWYFDEWGGDLTGSSSNPEFILMNGDKNVEANFITNRYTLDVYTTGNGSVTKDPDSANYASGTLVWLTAHPDPNDEFVYWSGNLSSMNNPESIRVDNNKVVMAHFTDNDNYTLRINVLGRGMVIKEPNQHLYTPGTWVKLSAIPDSGWNFINWMGNLISTNNPDSILMNSNKVVTARFSNISAGVWTQKESMPPLNAGSKHIKDGGALIGTSTSKNGTVLYAFQGTKTNYVKKYIFSDSSYWTGSDSISFGYKYPFTTPLKINKKYPGKGASFCYDGDKTIYATKGNGTREFWAYYIDTVYGVMGETLIGWKLKAYIPTVSGLKGGTSIRYYGDRVYLLAGAQKKDMSVNNFYCYDPTQDIPGGPSPWTALGRLPLGPYTKAWKDGSSIVIFNGMIYALKGSDKLNLFYMYDLAGDTWHRLEDLPLPDTSMGKYKKALKVKDGGATAADDNVIYAIKGGGANSFWRYIPGTPGLWTVLTPIPYLHKKSVPKAGAAMTYTDGKIWLLKGNKSPEFWCYTTTSDKANIKNQISNMSQRVIASNSEAISNLTPKLEVSPNPFTKHTTIRYTVINSGRISIKLYNTNGRLIETLVNDYRNAGSYSLEIGNRKLEIPCGIYFVKYESNTNISEVKLIVQ